MVKSILIRVVASLILALSIIFFLDQGFYKYETKTENSPANSSYGQDMDLDGYTDYCSKMNIKSGAYFEFWSKGYLKTIWRDTNVLKGHKEMQVDLDQNGFLEDYFITESSTHTYLNILEFEKDDTSTVLTFDKKLIYTNKFEGSSSLKSFLHADMDNDGTDELIFSIERGIERRQIIIYNSVKDTFIYSQLNFMNFSDIQIFDFDNDGYLDILFSTYATCNLPDEYVERVAEQNGSTQDTNYSDCFAYFGLLDKDLDIKFMKSLEGFTNMYRTAVVKEENDTYSIVVLESSMLDSTFEAALSKYDAKGNELLRKKLPLKAGGKAFAQTNPYLLIDLEILGKRTMFVQGLGDSIIELDEELNFVNYLTHDRFNGGSRMKKFDLNNDGTEEILINVDGGYLIYQDGFIDEYFARTPISSWNYSVYSKEDNGDFSGVYFVVDGGSFILKYEKNPNYYLKYLLYAGIFLGIYLILYGVQKYSSYQLEKDKKKLEIVVKERTVEIEQKNSSLEEQKILLEVKNNEILDSINYAKRIQTAILPSAEILESHFSNFFVLYKPKDIVAGDFYWLSKVGTTNKEDNSIGDLSECVLFGVADCTGHGVPGAMVSVVCNSALNRSVKEFHLNEPGLILDKTKEIVIEEFEKSEDEVKDGMDIALIRFNKKTLQLQYAGANNPLWILRNGALELEIIKADKHPIGKMDQDINFKTTTVQLVEGDTIYLFTDGYADQFGGSDMKPERKGGKKLKSANLKKIILQIQEKTMMEQQQYLEDAFEDWRGDLEQIDDVCIVGIKV